MTDFLICVGGIFATVAPFGALSAVLTYKQDRAAQPDPDALQDRPLVLFAPSAAFAALGIAALVSDLLLDVLHISGSSFEFAAAATMVPLAIRLLIFGDSMAAPRWKLRSYAWFVPFSLPLLAGPVSVIAAISYSDRAGFIQTIAAAAITLAVTAGLFATLPAWQKLRLFYVQMLGRLSGVLLVAMAAEMALDGLHRI
jgi:small neutral amino acid transporter SnatA (MarC family)